MKSNSSDAGRLVVRQLRKSFRVEGRAPIEVLRGLSFSVAQGEMVAIMGASGAGKSTLLQILGGLETADEGSVKLEDFEITGARAFALSSFRNRRAGFVFQSHHLLPDLTALENVAMPLLIGRKARREGLKLARVALERVGLIERADHSVGQLSGGERQRVAIARAVIKEPELVLADEPTGNLDAAVGDEIAALLASFCRERKAIVIIATHNERVARACDRVLLLKDGLVRAQGE